MREEQGEGRLQCMWFIHMSLQFVIANCCQYELTLSVLLCFVQAPTLTMEGGRLKKSQQLLASRDFETVPEPVWRALYHWYGANLSLPRPVCIPCPIRGATMGIYFALQWIIIALAFLLWHTMILMMWHEVSHELTKPVSWIQIMLGYFYLTLCWTILNLGIRVIFFTLLAHDSN